MQIPSAVPFAWEEHRHCRHITFLCRSLHYPVDTVEADSATIRTKTRRQEQQEGVDVGIHQGLDESSRMWVALQHM